MTTHAVVVVGGGPTGLMLAGELALSGADVAVVERRIDQHVAGSRAGGLTPRTLEVLDQRGIADRFVSQGQKHPVVHFPGAVLNIADLPTHHNYWLGLWQAPFEKTLAAWVAQLPVTQYRGREMTGFAQDQAGVSIELSDGASLRAAWLVGCDGGRSQVRKQARIDFPGRDPDISYLIFEAAMAGEPACGVRYVTKGICAIGKPDDGPRVRGVVTEPTLRQGDEPTLDELRGALLAAYDTDFGVGDVSWLSRFTDAARQAASYRSARVLLAGDAAHVHSPAGGQGLNLGVQDAVNLGWKLALVARGKAPDSLLDTYHAERHPVGARVLEHTLAITALSRGDERTTALRDLLAGPMQMGEARRWYGARMSGLDLRYELGEGHPLLGRRMPDLDLLLADGPTRLYALLHDARGLLLDFDALGEFDISPWADRVKLIRAQPADAWELPVIGPVPMPKAVLIRPDGHVAWVSEAMQPALCDTLSAWFGPGAVAARRKTPPPDSWRTGSSWT